MSSSTPHSVNGQANRRAAKYARRLAHLATRLERDDDAHVRVLVHELTQRFIDTTLRDDQTPAPPRLRRRGLLIINSKSGPDATSLTKLRTVVDALAEYGIGVDVRVKLKKSIARKEARRAARRGCRLVIAAGGDGTVAAVASGMTGTDATLGIVPLGTFNNTATN